MTPFEGNVWRILFASHADDPLAPGSAPEGRFHHHGQMAIYTSLSAEGASAAIQRYLAPGDELRVIVPLRVSAKKVIDLRPGKIASDPIPATSVVWQDDRAQDDRAQDRRARTWDISDGARQQGAQGILYPSRTRPDLSHLVLLGPIKRGVLTVAGPAHRWP